MFIDNGKLNIEKMEISIQENTDESWYACSHAFKGASAAVGAFQLAKPSDLLPELQGRLPIRVELEALNSDDFKRILKEPDYSLIKQYVALLKTENVDLEFSDDGIDAIANIASEVNSTVENIGARRLHTIIERILDDISFTATDRAGEKIIINSQYVKQNLDELVKDTDLSKFIL